MVESIRLSVWHSCGGKLKNSSRLRVLDVGETEDLLGPWDHVPPSLTGYEPRNLVEQLGHLVRLGDHHVVAGVDIPQPAVPFLP